MITHLIAFCSVRVAKSGRLIAFISAIPAHIKVFKKSVKVVEINFLCVHKKLRSKRLAPVLIREITRRVNLTGIFQACYTAGVVLPKPVTTCRYWHRSLNPKKLIEVRLRKNCINVYKFDLLTRPLCPCPLSGQLFMFVEKHDNAADD